MRRLTVLSAPRCGSTLVYNLALALLKEAGVTYVACGYVSSAGDRADIYSDEDLPVAVYKTHDIEGLQRLGVDDVVLLCYRHPLEQARSGARLFGWDYRLMLRRAQESEAALRRAGELKWSPIKFEDYDKNKYEFVEDLAGHLNLDIDIDSAALVSIVEARTRRASEHPSALRSYYARLVRSLKKSRVARRLPARVTYALKNFIPPYYDKATLVHSGHIRKDGAIINLQEAEARELIQIAKSMGYEN